MNTHRQLLRIGSLALDLELDGEGALSGVHLPITVPADLDTTTLAEMIRQLGTYRLKFAGTPFLKKVWQRMAEIPWGSAMTYGELAEAVGSSGGSRAVGRACAINPLPLIIPCHRVLAHEGMGGFGFGPEWKAKLLELETEPQP